MIYGSQYDAIMNWVLRNPNETEKSKVINVVPTHSKTTTGSTPDDVMNKIYDLGNNLREWTLEAGGTATRVRRGGDFRDSRSTSGRYNFYPGSSLDTFGSRLSLYII